MIDLHCCQWLRAPTHRWLLQNKLSGREQGEHWKWWFWEKGIVQCTYRCAREYKKDMLPFRRLNQYALEMQQNENWRLCEQHDSIHWHFIPSCVEQSMTKNETDFFNCPVWQRNIVWKYSVIAERYMDARKQGPFRFNEDLVHTKTLDDYYMSWKWNQILEAPFLKNN